ncbi:flavodoxin and radical SAM domain protein [Dissoconium aciculare CBS 342.82]|uniref:tRNA 4-demethylwyosine synthase (AdoMet-dependent) n=1 Tax=Dissoconium aciculare CBS 342.82 TaxID=1314786 RepID=A0A6J3M1R6_9PEZI|nr:flavodoxin and radical SAM domain protein [Dissoconium aciculare CBS 342.82]KAF1821444.1 flavodoxin and radical SAM domain protein [Dissoconium aciculare CBS 342.82]
MNLNQLHELPQELLYIWHAHRTGILLAAGILFAIVRLGLHWRSNRIDKYVLKHEIIDKTSDDTPRRSVVAQPEITPVNTQETTQTTNATRTKEPRRVQGNKSRKQTPNQDGDVLEHLQIYIFYFTLGGSTKAYAERLAANLNGASATNQKILPVEVHDLAEVDYDDYFITPPKSAQRSTASVYLILLPSYNIDTELSNFLSHMEDTHNDFRIDTGSLSTLAGYSVFGFGDRQEWPTEAQGYCTQAVEVDKWMAKLTRRKRAFPLGTGDIRKDVDQRLQEWQSGVEGILADLADGKGLGEGVSGSGDAVESGDEDDTEEPLASDSKPRRKVRSDAGDLEDIKVPIPVDFTSLGRSAATTNAPKAMVPKSSPTYASLTKQGYTIVGSHSGVKICRWTKSALRGRGSCYKYSFYGINSHLCMEATPSLSCSNKCVFCWRHGTNPVGTTWRWEVDEPDLVFEGMKAGHYSKIKMMRGVPGVRSERFAEAMRIRHCALSLVGEPIFYPHINALLAMLHAEHISSFLVCNAQHPDQLAALGPVTQLYVSIDASNKESLRKIDRPLHRDFWERFIRCMDILREKRFTHRTVFRLTLVKGFNIDDEASGYADLVERALPGFIEVKGVTYCGTSTAAGAGLSMQNVPFYEEVSAFVLALEKELLRRGLDYGIGAEHAHSCCILLADRKRFFRGRWHTLIDYEKFFQCVESKKPFSPEDYIGEATPEWAAWGKGGFDPRDVRVDRKGKPKVVEI